MCPAATSGRDYGMQICIVPFQGHKTVGTQPSVRINCTTFAFDTNTRLPRHQREDGGGLSDDPLRLSGRNPKNWHIAALLRPVFSLTGPRGVARFGLTFCTKKSIVTSALTPKSRRAMLLHANLLDHAFAGLWELACTKTVWFFNIWVSEHRFFRMFGRRYSVIFRLP